MPPAADMAADNPVAVDSHIPDVIMASVLIGIDHNM
jgi:hypothetical protein